MVSGLLDGDKVHFIVHHWPSRSGGEARSRPNRIKAAELNKKIIDSLHAIDPYAKIINMGDFNDDPTNQSIKKVLQAKSNREDVNIKELYNPMEDMHKRGLGTLAWRDGWNLFDQIIVSAGLLSKDFQLISFTEPVFIILLILQTQEEGIKATHTEPLQMVDLQEDIVTIFRYIHY